MRIAQYYHNGRLQIGRIEADQLLPLDFNGNLLEFIQKQTPVNIASKERLPLAHIQWAPPIHNPSKIIAIGLNYLDHIQESKGALPESPLVFAKFPNALVGHQAKIVWDETITQKVDFEAELAVIIGKKATCISEDQALEHVFGYTCANDVSARDLQFGDKQWVRGKSLDTFCPLGPWIVTADEIKEPQNLKIQCRVNGQVMQESHTGMMIFPVARLVHFLSKHFTLIAGDIVLTGTPHGVGAFRKPAVYLKTGDKVEVEIERIGCLSNVCESKP